MRKRKKKLKDRWKDDDAQKELPSTQMLFPQA